jgi:hypothetical protein
MRAAVMINRIAEASPRFTTRITAAFYLLTLLMGGVVLSIHGRLALVVDLIATGCYIAAMVLFYDLSRPVNSGVLRPGTPNDIGSRRAHAGND